MNLDQFTKKIHSKWPRLICEETLDRDNNPVYATTDWSIVYQIKTKIWCYNDAKSSSGSGKTLEEAIENVPSLDDDFY